MRAPLPSYDSRSTLLKVALAIAVPALALLVYEWLRPLLSPVFEPPFVAAIAVVCWYCGPLYAVGATLASALVLDYLFLAPVQSFQIADSGTVLRFFLYLAANGIVIGLIANLNRTRSQLASSEQIHRSLAELIPFGSWMADKNGNMRHVSESFLKALEATPEQCAGMGWLDFIEPDQRGSVEADWKECMRSGYFWDYEYRMVSRSGRKYVVLSRGVPLRSNRGRGKSWVGMHLDITEMERAIDERVRQARDIARFNAELDQFAYVSAHDLQEPLRMIASYLQLLERRYADKLDEEAHVFIGYAVEGATRLRALLQDLLVLQQVGKRAQPEAQHSLTSIVEKAIANVGALPPEASIECDALPSLVCDELEMIQLFENLIENAIKYARAGVPAKVRIGAVRTPDGWTFSVSDNGMGIAAEYRERIFAVFQRLHTQAQYPGTGIGLAISKKIVEVHGGRIWVESQPGEGSTFYFTLPG